MKKTTHNVLTSMALATALFTSVSNAEIDGSLTLGYSTDYEFRGALLGGDLVESNLSLSTLCPLTGATLGFNVWYASTNEAASFVDNEIDYTLSASKTFGDVSVSAGYIFYTYPEFSSTNSQEFYLTVSKPLFAGITGTVTAYYDIDLFDGWFFYGDLGRSFKLNESVSLNLNAGLGAYSSYAGAEDGINHYYAKAALAWTPKENLTVTPYVKFTDAGSDWASDFSHPTGDFGGDQVIGGVTVNVAF